VTWHRCPEELLSLDAMQALASTQFRAVVQSAPLRPAPRRAAVAVCAVKVRQSVGTVPVGGRDEPLGTRKPADAA